MCHSCFASERETAELCDHGGLQNRRLSILLLPALGAPATSPKYSLLLRPRPLNTLRSELLARFAQLDLTLLRCTRRKSGGVERQ